MTLLPHITIFESDEKMRALILRALTEEGLDDLCSFHPGTIENATALLSHDGNEIVPEKPEITQSDIFSKPFRIGTLIDRIHTHLARHNTQNDASVPIGVFDLDTIQNLLTRRADGTALRLTEKETAILQLLHKNKSKTVSRKNMLDEIWGYAHNVETHTLETHIYRLRQKIEKDAATPELLLTDEGGYRLKI